MSFFKSLNLGSTSRKKDILLDEAKTFIQVHYVRERGSERYAFNTLTLKDDPEREACKEWYNNHGNPDDFLEIVEYYLKEDGVKAASICSEYGLGSKVFTGSSSEIEKWEAVAICFGLDLNISETRALLKIAGYALTNSSETDLVIRYCIENDVYLLSDINYLLKKICDRTLEQIQ